MLPNAFQSAHDKLIAHANQPNQFFALLKWQGECEMHITIAFGYNPKRRDMLLQAFKHRYPNDQAHDWPTFHRWLSNAVAHMSVGRLPYLSLDDAIEASLDSP